MTGPPGLTIALDRAEIGRFHSLLQRGVRTRLTEVRTVLDFLLRDLALDREYVRERITTVLLDGQVVDALEEATLAPGAVLALSAAMPGLAGATLRRGGAYAAMRNEITRARAAAPAPPVSRGEVRVRLFNLLLDELGPLLLARGVVLERREAVEVLGRSLPPSRRSGPDEVMLQVCFS